LEEGNIMANIYNDSTGGINTAWKLVKYNAKAVQEAIDRDKTIGKKEAKLIHALLKGRGNQNG
jgi:hypothetical protein